MSGTTPTEEQTAAAVESSRPSSPGHGDSVDLRSAIPNSNASSVGLGTQLTDIQELVIELRKLTQALDKTSERACEQIPRNPTDIAPPKPSAFSDNVKDCLGEVRELLEKLPKHTRERLGDLRVQDRDKTKALYSRLVEDSTFLHLWGSDPRSPAEGGAYKTGVKCVKYTFSETDVSEQWFETNWPVKVEVGPFGSPCLLNTHEPGGTSCTGGSRSEDPPRCSCFGSLWWFTDMKSPPKDRDYLSHNGIRSINIDMMAFLAHFFKVGTKTFVSDDYDNYKAFLLAFVKPSHPSVKRSRYEVTIEKWRKDPDPRLELQYHLRHLTPITLREDFSNPSVEGNVGVLTLQRQKVKIEHVPHGSMQDDARNQTERDIYFEERALSVSLIKFYDEDGTFRLLVLGDKCIPVAVPSPDGKISDVQRSEAPYARIGIDPWTSGEDSGPAHFLVALFVLLESWHNSWNTTLDAIDKFISFEMSRTLVQGGLDNYMFDNSSSMSLSRQYFTVFQVLRIARQWIDDNFAEWKRAKIGVSQSNNHWQTEWKRKPVAAGQSLEDQLDKITALLTSQTEQLRQRIDGKVTEVESLRNGLFNATSLQEAKKGMAMNRAIYVFTAVTIIFAPLGFITAFWALPILNTTPEGNNSHPSLPVFMATFVVIPSLTYIICGCLAWYLESPWSWESFTGYIRDMLHVGIESRTKKSEEARV